MIYDVMYCLQCHWYTRAATPNGWTDDVVGSVSLCTSDTSAEGVTIYDDLLCVTHSSIMIHAKCVMCDDIVLSSFPGSPV